MSGHKNEFFDENSKFVFASTVVVMLITHGFCFLNIMYAHDSLRFSEDGDTGKVALGRWLYPFFVSARHTATPWIMGVLSIIYISMAVVLVTKLFELSRIQGIGVAILFGTNVALTGLFCSYIHDADADCMSIFLACLAAYSFKKFPHIIRVIVSALSIVLTLAIYQANISVTVGLFLLILIRDSLKCKTWKDVSDCLGAGFMELLTLIMATVIYIPTVFIAADIYGSELSFKYNGAAKIQLLTASDVFGAIPLAYKTFMNHFLGKSAYNSGLLYCINWIALVLIIVSIGLYLYSHRDFLGGAAIFFPCLLLFPLGLNSIVMVSMGTLHMLMIFAYCLIYLIPLIVLNDYEPYKTKDNDSENKHGSKHKLLSKTIASALIIVFLAMGYYNAVYANGAYVFKKLIYEDTRLHAQKVWNDINETDGYTEGLTEVVFMGFFMESTAQYTSELLARYYDNLIGTYRSAITQAYKVRIFYDVILGREMYINFNDEELRQNPEYIDMPAYPEKGYCKIIDGRMVVKMSYY